ncbi:glycosyl transferase family 2 [Tumebacillus sp. BK434]|uniref:glycosyltransferase n=1 Tax=Tumebacillus sp. BK434 TaxID=2512169 RepID=UPI00104C76C5|nr:glycosyltransferase [Tumebacillus sp. BK434]TCP57815.1 glycosyl transferase family 2 [Tumebacillus sp. BK434]
MLALFIWGFALYGIFMALWKAVRFMAQRNRRGVPVTAILIVREGASYIEGILRTLTTAEPFCGRELEVVVIDCGSRDETVKIVESIAQKRGTVSLIRAGGEDPALSLPALFGSRGRSVHCLFDLRGKVSPLEVVPTLAAFWSDETV